MRPEDLQDETAEVLAKLIRFKTVNPPGNERECLRVARVATCRTPASRSSSSAPSPSARTSSRNTAGRRRGRAGAGLRLPCGHRAGRLRGLERGPLGRRDPRRLPLRPRHDRHEEPDGRRGRRGGDARAQRRALQGHAEGDRGRRRGDRRRARRQVDHREPARPVPRRLPAQRGRGRDHAVRRPPPVRRLRGREGHVPLQRRHHRHRRARLRAGPGAATRCSSSRR